MRVGVSEGFEGGKEERTHVRFVESLDLSGHGVDARGAVVRLLQS